MRTAEEMLQASKKISVSPIPCFLNAYQAIEKILLPDEDVEFCFIRARDTGKYGKYRKNLCCNRSEIAFD